MRTRLQLAVAMTAALVGGGLALAGGGPAGPSRVLLPPGRPAVVDVHQAHQPGQPGCAACHPNAAGSRWASDRLVPGMEQCGACHPAAANVAPLAPVTAECGPCHGVLADGDRPVRGSYPRPNIRFPHKAHAERGVECGACHLRAAAGARSGPVRDLPEMEFCYTCHQRRAGASTACRTCHIVERDGRLATRYGDVLLTPPRWLAGPTHGADWVQRHAPVAGADTELCAACHREKMCQDCHSGRLRPRDVHPGDWLATHGVNTRLDSPRCLGCHRAQTFCITCHRRAGVAPDAPTSARPPGSGRYHRGMTAEQVCRRAKYDITACASCHSEGSCIQCHVAINPHPAGFSRRCQNLARRNQRACVKCHNADVWRRCE